MTDTFSSSSSSSSPHPHSFEVFTLNRAPHYVFARGSPSLDSLTVQLASMHHSTLHVYSYSGTLTALQPPSLHVDLAQFATWLLLSLAISNVHPHHDQDCEHTLTDDPRDPTRAALRVVKHFASITVELVTIPLAHTAGPAALAAELELVRQVKERIAEMTARRSQRSPVHVQRQAYADLLLRAINDRSTDVSAVENRLLEGCLRLLNAEKAKVREARARNERLRAEIEALKHPSLEQQPPSAERAKESASRSRRTQLPGEDTDSDDDRAVVDDAEEEKAMDVDEVKDDEEKKAADEDVDLWQHEASPEMTLSSGIDLSLPITSSHSIASTSTAATRYAPWMCSNDIGDAS